MSLKKVILSPEAIECIEEIKKSYSEFYLTDLDCIEVALEFFLVKKDPKEDIE